MNSKFQNEFFLICSSWLIESRTSDEFKFGWVEHILLTFESSSSVSVRVGEESIEDILRIKSVWNDLKAKIWIRDVLDFNTKFYQNLSKLDVETKMLVMYAKQWISCAKITFWSKILKFGAGMHKLKICMSNHEETRTHIYFNPNWSHFYEFWWKMQVQARMGLSMSWEVRWRRGFSS